MSLWDNLKQLGANLDILSLAKRLLAKPEGYKTNGQQAQCQQDTNFLIKEGLAEVKGGKLVATQKLKDMQ